MNATDLPPCTSAWTFQDTSTYAKLDYYLAKSQAKNLPYYQTFNKLFGTWNWQPKQGNKVRAVRKEPSPINRSVFYPNQRTQPANRDMVALRETKEEALLYHHKLESELLYYDADFANFLDNHKEVSADITRKLAIYPELFYRTAIWELCPFVYICGFGFLRTNHITNGVITSGAGKSPGDISNILSKCTNPLTLQELDRIQQQAIDEMNFIPYQGGVSQGNGAIDKLLVDKHILITERRIASNFRYDPFFLANRPLERDVVTAGFEGMPLGNVMTRCERFPLRFAADGTIPVPQVIENAAAAFDQGASVTDPNFASAPFVVSWMVGDSPYEVIKPGPPPKEFQGAMDKDKFQGMDWNGKVRETKNVLIPCPAADLGAGNQSLFDTNKYGDVTQFISQITMGIKPVNRNNMFPIISLRPLPAIPNV